MTQLSKNFNLSEFTKSTKAQQIGLDNRPTNKDIEHIKALVENILQPLRDKIGEPITITSGYRSIELNRAINGSPSSQHVLGQAVDFKCRDMAKAFDMLRRDFVFDQLIWEFGDSKQPDWIHVSYKCFGNRKEVLEAYKDNGRTKYKAI